MPLARSSTFDNQLSVFQPKMAPNLASCKHELIYDMIHSSELSITEMARAAGCNKRTISRISSNIRVFGSVKVPLIKDGQPRSITPVMLEALCDHLSLSNLPFSTTVFSYIKAWHLIVDR